MLPIGPQLPPGASSSKDQTHTQALYGAAAAAKEKEKEKEKNVRMAGGKVWKDDSLAEWAEGDYRIFVGDLGNEVGDEMLHKAFAHYTSLDKVKVIRDKITGKSKGFGFVSLLDPIEFLKALKVQLYCFVSFCFFSPPIYFESD